MKKETENKQVFSFKKGHTLPMSDEYFDFLENCQKALLIGNLRGMIVDNNDDGKPSFFQTTGIGDKKAKMAFTFYKRFSDINKFTHFLVHEDDLQYYKDFIENFALETGQVFTHRLRGKSTEYKIAFIPPIVDQNVKSSINIGDEYRKDLETLSSFLVGSVEQDKQIKYMLQKYVAICLNYTDGKLNEVYTDHGNITVIVYKDNKMFTNVYSKVNKITGEKIEFRDFDNVPKMFNDRINGFKGKKTMTYDFILMNPPYDKNLHLKIVEQSIPMLSDNGILVNLSPIRWLKDKLLDYKKGTQYNVYEETVSKHIKDLIEINREVAQKWFENDINEPLGVYCIVKGDGGFDYESLHKSDEPEFVKVIALVLTKQLPSILSVRSKEGSPDYNGHFIRLPKFRGHPGHKDWCNVLGLSFEEMTTRPSFGTCDATTTFSSDIEVRNFFSSVHTTFYRYLCLISKSAQRVPYGALPWMGDCTNPRTGLVGYEGEWLDEDFREYFGITDSEWEEIERVMKPYL